MPSAPGGEPSGTSLNPSEKRNENSVLNPLLTVIGCLKKIEPVRLFGCRDSLNYVSFNFDEEFKAMSCVLLKS